MKLVATVGDRRKIGGAPRAQLQIMEADQLDLFGNARLVSRPANRRFVSREATRLHELTAQLAQHEIFIGTSSWKYPGWCGLIYAPDRYASRGKFAESRFNRECLAEYAETFSTVCVDGAYYQFPTEIQLTALADQVPAGFKFSFKVTDEITIKEFPQIARMAKRAGQTNPHFLDAELFKRKFLGPCEAVRDKVGLLIFEFSRFHTMDFRHAVDFAEALDGFLSRLPKGWDYGVEIRNEEFLGREYFEVLRRNAVTHVFNSWDAMPPVTEQMEKIGDALEGLPIGARFLLKPGRGYQKAVEKFSPYDKILEVYEEGRTAAAALIELAWRKRSRLYLYGNNRFEGCSPLTLLAVLERVMKKIWDAAK